MKMMKTTAPIPLLFRLKEVGGGRKGKERRNQLGEGSLSSEGG